MVTGYSETMAEALARDWWVVLVRGIAAVLFGLLAFIWPHITLLALVFLFGIYALVDGVLSIGRAVRAARESRSWVWPTLGGIVSIAAGILAFVWPGLTALILLFIIAAWAVVSGIFDLIAGIVLHDEISNEWLLILGGVISVAFGVVVFTRPGVGALAIVWLIGAYAIVIGVQRIALAFHVRDWQQHPVTGQTRNMPPANGEKHDMPRATA
jgi:uncharacterized membrane protein HdeD (DUF308 family)